LPYARPTSDPVGTIVHPGESLFHKVIGGCAVDRHWCARLRAASTRRSRPVASGKKERLTAMSTVKTFASALPASAPARRAHVSPVIYLP
jgi:hypothetical protein